MDVAQVRAFLAVAEELHFGRAAASLHMAQPPLSRTIKQLERELGATLFDRTTRSVELTPAGRALVEPAREVLAALRRATAAVRSASDGESGLVRLGFAGISTHALVADLARAVRQRHPGIQLELTSQQYAQPLLDRLHRGDMDLALGRWDVIPPEMTAEVVRVDALVLAVATDHPLAVRSAVSVADLAREQFISLSPQMGSVLPERLQRLAAANGFVPDVIQVAPDTQTALALVGAGVGAHLTLASVAEQSGDNDHVHFARVLDEAPDVHLRMAWRTADTNPALRLVLQHLDALAR